MKGSLNILVRYSMLLMGCAIDVLSIIGLFEYYPNYTKLASLALQAHKWGGGRREKSAKK